MDENIFRISTDEETDKLNVITGKSILKYSENIIKDGFICKGERGNLFNYDYEFLRKPYKSTSPPTLVFYLHGNISLAKYINKNLDESEIKLSSTKLSQLGTIYVQWKLGSCSPLFVCEGTKEKNWLN
ncbi:DUF4917 family protein [Legionella sp. MW5194]|nr:DUF4917 family protein [Legionella sp. MW5194]QRN02555.1 DUF4917 family protein [Legionella sp. MW5194]